MQAVGPRHCKQQPTKPPMANTIIDGDGGGGGGDKSV